MYFSDEYVNYDDNYQLAKSISEKNEVVDDNDEEEPEHVKHIQKINEAKVMEYTKEEMRAKSYTALLEAYFVRGLAEAYVKALPVDEGSVPEHMLIEYFENKINEDVNITELIIENRNNNRFLKTLYEDSKYLAGKNADKLADKNTLTKESINDFLIDNKDEDDKILNNNKFNENEVSDIIKNKVIDTIKSEKEYAKKIKEEDDQIMEAREKNEDVTIDETVPQHSLFKSLMIASSKKYKAINEDSNDAALLDAICEYARLELFNTLNISSHSTQEIKELCESLVYDSDASLIY